MLSVNQNREILINKFSKENVIFNDRYTQINVLSANISDTVKELKEDAKLQYDQLIDLTAVDYPSRSKRFDIVYILLSMTQNKRILVKSLLVLRNNTTLIKSSVSILR